MKAVIWKLFGAFLVGLPVGCYTAFVIECFWNWFAVPALHVPEISFLPLLGLWWLIDLLISRPSDPNDRQWILTMSVLELCVPAEKQAELKNLKDEPPLISIVEGLSAAFGKIVSNTVTLLLGFALHLIIT